MENQLKPIYKLKAVRQERRSNISGRVFIRANGNMIEVRDYTSFSLSAYFECQSSATAMQVELFVDSTQITDLTLEFVRKDMDDLGQIFSAFRITSTPLDLTQVEAALKTHMMLEECMSTDKGQHPELPSQFVVTTYELKHWLGRLEKGVEALALKSFDTSERELTEYENTVCQITAHYLSIHLPQWFHSLAEAVKDSSTETMEKAFQFFRSQVGPFLYQSYYSHRALNKPLGYAGDFEMMNTVYLKDKRGDSLFARCVHTYFTDVPEARAVRNRAEFLLGKILATFSKKQESFKVLAVACGPAQELQDLINFHSDKIPANTEIHLLDQDESALQYSQKMLQCLLMKKKIKAKIFLHRRQIKDVIAQGLEMKGFDLIYSAGLFDYLTDPVATFAANTLFKSLGKNGELIIGNFNVGIPNEFGMSLIMDWQLIYRSKSDLIRLFQGASQTVRVEEEPEGINLFAIIDKNAA